MPFVEEAGHSAYPVTLTGMGDRVHLANKEVGMETAIQDVLNVARFNGLDEYVVVGHSFAGKVAAAVADRAKGKVRKAIYVDAFRPERVATPQGAFNPAGEFGAPPRGEPRHPAFGGNSRTHREGRCGEGQGPDARDGDPLAGQAGH